MNKQARKEQAIKYLKQLDIYKPYIAVLRKKTKYANLNTTQCFGCINTPKSKRR